MPEADQGNVWDTIVFEFSLRFPDETEAQALVGRVICTPLSRLYQTRASDRTGEACWKDAGDHVPFAVTEACFRRLTAAPDFVPPQGRHRTNEHGVQFYDLGCLVTPRSDG